jgi:hypothetical protein
MTFIHDEMTIASDLVRHFSLADETLYQSNLDSPGGLTATRQGSHVRPQRIPPPIFESSKFAVAILETGS